MGHKSERVSQIADIFKQAGISCQLSEDIRKVNGRRCAGIVSSTSHGGHRRQGGEGLDHPEMAGVIRQIVGEVAAVSAAVKVPLAPDMAEKVVKWTQELRDIHTSMYDDWKAKRPTEIDYLNGYIVRVGTGIGHSHTGERSADGNGGRRSPKRTVRAGHCAHRRRRRSAGLIDQTALGQLPQEQRVDDISEMMPSMRGRRHPREGPAGDSSARGGRRPCHLSPVDGKYAATLHAATSP